MTRANFTHRRLTNQRRTETFALQARGLNFTATASRFDYGSRCEIFNQNHKADGIAGIIGSDAAITASPALRPLDVLRKALKRDGPGRAIGPLVGLLNVLSSQNRSDAV